MGFSVFAVVAATFTLAGFVKGVIGLGLPTVAIGLLAIVMTPAQAASLLVVPSLLTNVWQAMGPALVLLVRRLWPMLLGICLGTGLGGGLLAADDGTRASVDWGWCSHSTAFSVSPRSSSSCRHRSSRGCRR
jgi:uncharacterized membrane protein YfcA